MYNNCISFLRLDTVYAIIFATVIFAVLARCSNSRGVNFVILLMLSLL